MATHTKWDDNVDNDRLNDANDELIKIKEKLSLLNNHIITLTLTAF